MDNASVPLQLGHRCGRTGKPVQPHWWHLCSTCRDSAMSLLGAVWRFGARGSTTLERSRASFAPRCLRYSPLPLFIASHSASGELDEDAGVDDGEVPCADEEASACGDNNGACGDNNGACGDNNGEELVDGALRWPDTSNEDGDGALRWPDTSNEGGDGALRWPDTSVVVVVVVAAAVEEVRLGGGVLAVVVVVARAVDGEVRLEDGVPEEVRLDEGVFAVDVVGEDPGNPS